MRSQPTVAVQALIKQRYAKLVRKGSKFWNVSGADVSFSLFRGLEVNMESLRSLAAGGVAFATPDDPKEQPAKEGAAFPLYDKPVKEWLEWAPKIPPVPVKQVHEKDLNRHLVKPPAKQPNNVRERRRSED